MQPRHMKMTVTALCGLTALALAGCAGNPVASSLNSLAALTSPPPAPVATGSKQPDEIGCPHVEVIEGESMLRAASGPDNSQVRYQYSLGNIARECTLIGGQLSIKVGIEGRVLIGPAGAPGAFSVPVRFVIRRESDQKPAVSKFYKVAATVAAGQTSTAFSLVSDPLVVPYTGAAADEDYTVLVGFDAAGGGEKTSAKKRRRR